MRHHTLITRRRALIGLIAAPFVAKAEFLMPVRSPIVRPRLTTEEMIEFVNMAMQKRWIDAALEAGCVIKWP